MKSVTRSLIMLVGIGLALLLPAQVGAADNNDLRKLSAEWWQWAFSFAVADLPFLSTAG